MNPDHEFLPFYTGDGGGQLTVCGVRGCREPITSHPVNHPWVPKEVGRSKVYVCAEPTCYRRQDEHPI
jgi:hypothetical protein